MKATHWSAALELLRSRERITALDAALATSLRACSALPLDEALDPPLALLSASQEAGRTSLPLQEICDTLQEELGSDWSPGTLRERLLKSALPRTGLLVLRGEHLRSARWQSLEDRLLAGLA